MMAESHSQSVSDLRLVLVGKTGAGKSSSGNTILGRDAFRGAFSQSSVTRQCCKKKGGLIGKQVSVIDTPSLFDTSQPDDSVKREISKCINMSAPGPHAILLVIRVGPFTAEERDAVQKVEEVFGEEAWKYTIILFTHGDRVHSDFKKMLAKPGPELQETLNKVGHRYQVFNNIKADDRGQVLDLLEKVDNMVAANGGGFYSNYTYQEVERMLGQREAELREIYKNKMKEKIKAVRSKYKRKRQKVQQERQPVEERLKSELEEVRRYYHALESRVRHMVEQTVEAESFSQILNQFHENLKLD